MLPVVVHVSVAAGVGVRDGVAHKAPPDCAPEGSGAGQTVGVCLLAHQLRSPLQNVGKLEAPRMLTRKALLAISSWPLAKS